MFTILELPAFTFGFVLCIPFMFVFHFHMSVVGWSVGRRPSSLSVVVHRAPLCSGMTPVVVLRPLVVAVARRRRPSSS